VASNEIKLKRSSVQSKVPSISDLTLGELSVNTFDGKLFFKKNNGSDSIESIVTTNAQITGSVELTGALTSSLSLIENDTPSTNMFLVKINGSDKVKVNSEGTFIIKESATLPSGESGAISISGSNFFVYL
jgi:hypothetical protein|tara:strand:+ start:408 stop:800 length:393 start_codon:yes stop_codon:yes gene_type:complete